jgi:hypothetical protein
VVLGGAEDDTVVVVVFVFIVFPGTDWTDVIVAKGGPVVVVSPVAGLFGSHDDAIVPLNCDDTVGSESRYDINEVGIAPLVTVSLSG